MRCEYFSSLTIIPFNNFQYRSRDSIHASPKATFSNWCINCVLMRVMERRERVSFTAFHYPHQHTADTPVCLPPRRRSQSSSLKSWHYTTFSKSITRSNMLLHAHVVERNRARGSIPFNNVQVQRLLHFQLFPRRRKNFKHPNTNPLKPLPLSIIFV